MIGPPFQVGVQQTGRAWSQVHRSQAPAHYDQKIAKSIFKFQMYFFKFQNVYVQIASMESSSLIPTTCYISANDNSKSDLTNFVHLTHLISAACPLKPFAESPSLPVKTLILLANWWWRYSDSSGSLSQNKYNLYDDDHQHHHHENIRIIPSETREDNKCWDGENNRPDDENHHWHLPRLAEEDEDDDDNAEEDDDDDDDDDDSDGDDDDDEDLAGHNRAGLSSCQPPITPRVSPSVLIHR